MYTLQEWLPERYKVRDSDDVATAVYAGLEKRGQEVFDGGRETWQVEHGRDTWIVALRVEMDVLAHNEAEE